MKQEEVAADLNVSVATVVNWEKGRTEPEIRFVPAILASLRYDPRPKPASLGERLTAFREGKGWTQGRLAAELKVNPTTISRWKLGKKEPWGKYRERIDLLLG